jgi:hypothetical protein
MPRVVRCSMTGEVMDEHADPRNVAQQALATVR